LQQFNLGGELSASRVVIKLGGSVLYSDPCWLEKLKLTISLHQGKAISIIVGGGEIIEGVRTLHKIYPQLTQAKLHWNCVTLLDATCEIASQLLPLEGVIEDPNSFERWHRSSIPRAKWVKVTSFYSPDTLRHIPTEWHPALDWSTTTDALAILIALRWNASEVLLLKSCDISSQWTLEEAAEMGIVDRETPRLASYLPPGSVRLIPFA